MQKGNHALNATEAVQESYNQGITDEFILPTVITQLDGKPVAQITEGDIVYCL